MKLLKAIAATACALAIASAAQAKTYTDLSENYEMGHSLATGDNGGTGFGAWVVESHGSGDGWAGCGIWDPSANSFQGDWAGKTCAFGIIGKGDGYGISAYRPFRAPLAVGDSFSLEMGVNWDPNSGIDALKGFVVSAEGGTHDILAINHRSNPGNIAINGNADSEILNAFGVYPMKWTFTAKDATTLTVTATPRDGSETIYEQDWTVSTSALDGFRIQSSGQNPYEDEKAATEAGETAQMWADRRQTYFDNFTLDIAGELPELVTLGFASGEYAVSSATQTLSYTLTRSSSEGALDVTVSSSDASFVPGTTVSFADGEAEKEFTLSATLTGPGNYAKITASATSCDPATYEVKGPQYRLSVEKYEVKPEENEVKFWMDWDDNGVRDDAKVTIEADPDGSLELPAEWTWNEKEEGGAYVESSFKALSSGTLILKYDGVQFADYGVTVLEPLVPGFELSGPTSVKLNSTHTYTLKATLTEEESDCTVSLTPETAGSASPNSFDLLDPAEDGFYYQDIEVEFTEAGPVTITVADADDEYTAKLDITVRAPVDPSKFDDYVAYDDASLYDGEFDMNSLGAGSEGFNAWTVYKSSAQYGGALVTDADNGFPAILTEGSALAIYANGDNPDYALCRPFVNDLQPGQKASVEFVVPDASGTFYVQFARVWEGTPYSRFEVWSSDGKVGVNIDGAATDSKELGWSANARRIIASVQRAADGSDYTLSLSGYNEGSEFVDDIYKHVIDSDVGSWHEGIQGIVVGGYDLGKDMIFNKLIIKQVEEPVKVRTIGIAGTWNMDATGDYDFIVGPSEAGEAIGTVALSVTPDDGRVVLSTTSVEVPGDDVATFTVTVTSLPEEGEAVTRYTITATPSDEAIPAAEFGVEPSRPFCYLHSENWQHTTDEGSIWLCLKTSPSFYGTYAITSEDDSVLSVPEDSTPLVLDEGNTERWFSVQIVDAGSAKIFATLEGQTDPACEYGFTINPGADPDVEIPAPTPIKGKGLAWNKSILDNGFVLRGTQTLGTTPDKEPWQTLVADTDYVVEEDQVVVLYSSKYRYIALLKP